MDSAQHARMRAAWLFAAVLAFVALLSACSAAPAAESESAATGEGAAATGEGAAPAGESWQGIPVGITAEGIPFKGDANAPISLAMYSDFQCPFCARFFVNTEPGIMENYVSTGQVKLLFHDLPIEQLHPNAMAAHEAALCVADQGAPLYWAMYEALFMAQSEWSEQADPAPTFAAPCR